ncbi:MAG: porin family protein [Salinivirgaceae bacterium]|jgi:hypothetical protein|nr:porin family protein [Salinivirgaceae bacterium]
MRKITLLALSVMFTFAVQAQLFNIAGYDVGYFYLGPKLGVNASYNTADAAFGGDEKTANYGYQFGAVAKLGFTDKLSIQPELIFSSKGASSKSGESRVNSNAKYFGLPVIAKYAFLAVSGVDIYGSGGFYTDYLTGLETIVKQDGTVEWEEKTTDLSPYNRVDFGFSIGGGANIDFDNNDKLNIDLRISHGVTNIEKNSGSSSSRNTSIQLSAIYLLDMTRWISFGGAKKTEGSDAYEEESAPAGGSKVE